MLAIFLISTLVTVGAIYFVWKRAGNKEPDALNILGSAVVIIAGMTAFMAGMCLLIKLIFWGLVG